MSAVEWNTNIPNIMVDCFYDDYDAFLDITLAEASWYHLYNWQIMSWSSYIYVVKLLLTLPEHMSSPPVFSGVRVTRSLVLYVYFVDRCLSFCTFFFGHCVVCSSSIHGLWLPPFGIFKVFLQYYTFNILDI